MPELREATGALGEAASGSRRKITIISAGWGSSGYYSAGMLEADGPKVFPIGTQMFLDHPTASQARERPERSVLELAACITSTPRMEGTALVAEARVFSTWKPTIDELAEHIGVSIRAAGETEFGEAEGRHGTIVKSLDEGISVDFVTRAGRGGKVGEVIESRRRVLMESARVSERLQSQVNKELSDAGKERWGGNSRYVYVEDFDPEAGWVVYCVSPESGESKYVRVDYSNASAGAELGDAATEVKRVISFEPVTGPVAETRRSSGDNPEAHMADDTRLSELEESVRKLTTNVTALEARATKAEQERDAEKLRADRAEEAIQEAKAERIIAEALAAKPADGEPAMPKLPERATQRVIEAAKGDKLPLTEDGKLDKDRLIERVRKAAKDEADYLAEAGVTTSTAGRVTGMGSSSTLLESSGDDEDDDRALAEVFGGLGMSEKVAARAAQGR